PRKVPDHLLRSIAGQPGEVQFQGLIVVVWDRCCTICVLVTRAAVLCEGHVALLFHDPKKGFGFFWQSTDDANIILLGRFLHCFSFNTKYNISFYESALN